MRAAFGIRRNETHWSMPHYVRLYAQGNATANPATRKQPLSDFSFEHFSLV
jgi:hypothetical protein